MFPAPPTHAWFQDYFCDPAWNDNSDFLAIIKKIGFYSTGAVNDHQVKNIQKHWKTLTSTLPNNTMVRISN